GEPSVQAAAPRVHRKDQLARGRQRRGFVSLRLLQEVDHRSRRNARDGREHHAFDGRHRGVPDPRHPQPEDGRSPLTPVVIAAPASLAGDDDDGGGRSGGGTGASDPLRPFRIGDEPYYRAAGDEVTLFATAYAARVPIMLKGPTGCGKTRLLEHMAW